jgi:hypothetical protein
MRKDAEVEKCLRLPGGVPLWAIPPKLQEVNNAKQHCRPDSKSTSKTAH